MWTVEINVKNDSVMNEIKKSFAKHVGEQQVSKPSIKGIFKKKIYLKIVQNVEEAKIAKAISEIGSIPEVTGVNYF